MKIVIIGYGNTLRSDDGVGCVSAEMLEKRLAGYPVEIIQSQQLNPEHTFPVSQAELAIFIDADSTIPTGEIANRNVFPPDNFTLSSSHHFDPEKILGLTRQLYGTSPRACLYSMGAASFDLGEDLSDPVIHALPEMIDQIEQLVRSRIEENRA